MTFENHALALKKSDINIQQALKNQVHVPEARAASVMKTHHMKFSRPIQSIRSDFTFKNDV